MSSDAPAAEKIEGRGEFALTALAIAQSARRQLLLLTYDFDRRLYGGDAFVEAVKRFVLADDHAHLHVLINQPRLAVQGGHRLIELGRQLPSRIQFRELLEERVLTHRGELLIADQRAVLERREPDALYARYTPEAALMGKQRSGEFLQLWDESPTARELRVLGL